MGNFEQLHVWRESRQLVAEVYRITRVFPPEERFALTQQLRRAAVSIVSNIAEACGRGRRNEFLAFIRIARGSANELSSQLHLTVDLGLTDSAACEPVAARANRVGRMLSGMLRMKPRFATRRHVRASSK
jgi:four helix bundle protein